jgi:hypothetical protein
VAEISSTRAPAARVDQPWRSSSRGGGAESVCPGRPSTSDITVARPHQHRSRHSTPVLPCCASVVSRVFQPSACGGHALALAHPWRRAPAPLSPSHHLAHRSPAPDRVMRPPQLRQALRPSAQRASRMSLVLGLSTQSAGGHTPGPTPRMTVTTAIHAGAFLSLSVWTQLPSLLMR